MAKPPVNLATITILPLLAGAIWALEVGALDGQWCSGDGQTIKVSGTHVVAANGLPAIAVYSKNALSFIEPRADGRNGPEIWVERKGLNAVRVSIVSALQKEPPPHDLWTRCRATS
ncbi:MAG: hypothetical protein OER56_14865 [Hyphomicrobiales bacterium]|nr:hypothetical protein [Hyphomicrobiales bacterium]